MHWPHQKAVIVYYQFIIKCVSKWLPWKMLFCIVDIMCKGTTIKSVVRVGGVSVKMCRQML
jgi:hypothetical protein